MIPAYEYPQGVKIILDFIKASQLSNFECLIKDDSVTDKVGKVVKAHSLFKDGHVNYEKNTNSQGAINNWNSLIDESKGDYLLFLHHDECPVELDFFIRLKEIILKKGGPDLIFLRSAQFYPGSTNYKLHMPPKFTRFVLSKFPQYLFRRNLVGSPSNIVFKRAFSSHFNPQLSWLVDVEWIYRQLSIIEDWVLCNDLIILSIHNNEKSITGSLGNKIPEIRRKESEFLSKEFKHLWIFRILAPQSLKDNIYIYLEQFIWICFRGIKFFSDKINSRRIPDWLEEYKF